MIRGEGGNYFCSLYCYLYFAIFEKGESILLLHPWIPIFWLYGTHCLVEWKVLSPFP